MSPMPTLSQLFFAGLLIGILYLLGIAIARGLDRLTKRITARRSSFHHTGKGNVDA